MNHIEKLVISFVFCTPLYGCTSVSTQLPTPGQAQTTHEARIQEEQAFSRLHTMQTRLETVSARVLQANAKLCSRTAYDLGVLIHRRKSYPKTLRGAAQRWLGANDEPSVLLVREDSIAAKAGIKIGDVFLTQKGNVTDARRKKPVRAGDTLYIRRAGETMALDVKDDAPKTCDYPVHLSFSGAVNAYANGRSIRLTTAMMDFAKTDEQLAMIIGHELAHNTMDHVRKAVVNAVLSGFATRYTRPFEAEADYVGLYYTARAGYDLDGVEAFWRKLGVRNPKSAVRAKTHPTTPQRNLAAQLTATEIANKQEEKLPLIPNYKTGKAPKNAR